MKQAQHMRGLSLVELMVSLALGAFLILGVVNVLLSSKDSGQVENSLARLQENGRIALDMIVADIRDAQYIGCNPGTIAPVVIANGLTYDGVAGYERTSSGWSPSLPTKLNSISTTARTGSDVLSLQHAAAQGAAMTADVVPTSTSVAVDDNSANCITNNDLMVLASCTTVHVFRVTNTPDCTGSATTFAYATTGNSTTTIQPGYSSANDELFQFFDKTWYVADTGRRRTALDIPVYALYRIENGVANEMIEGVEYMQVLYGEQLTSGNIRYVPADDSTLDINNVVSVRIGLLVQSYDPVLDAADTRAYQVLDQSIDSTGTTYTHNGDLTLRRVFHTTAILRNRPNTT